MRSAGAAAEKSRSRTFGGGRLSALLGKRLQSLPSDLAATSWPSLPGRHSLAATVWPPPSGWHRLAISPSCPLNDSDDDHHREIAVAPEHDPPNDFSSGILLAIVGTLLPSFMINEAIMRIGATRTAVIGSVGPALTMLLAIGVLGEPTSSGHFAGMAVAMIGVSLVTGK